MKYNILWGLHMEKGRSSHQGKGRKKPGKRKKLLGKKTQEKSSSEKSNGAVSQWCKVSGGRDYEKEKTLKD